MRQPLHYVLSTAKNRERRLPDRRGAGHFTNDGLHDGGDRNQRGEPTLKWDGLIQVVRTAKNYLPNTSVQLLSNGRCFKFVEKAQELSAVRHPGLIVGIPINSAAAETHDYVVQRRGAFDDTILGLMNLKRCGIPVEIRVVIQRANAQGLLELASFISRNLAFADHIAFMAIEVHGYALENYGWVWVDPLDYAEELDQAVSLLAAHRLPVSIFNIPLCLLPDSAQAFARCSISDWKVEYLPTCTGCLLRSGCCGLFGTSDGHHSRGIHAIASA